MTVGQLDSAESKASLPGEGASAPATILLLLQGCDSVHQVIHLMQKKLLLRFAVRCEGEPPTLPATGTPYRGLAPAGLAHGPQLGT